MIQKAFAFKRNDTNSMTYYYWHGLLGLLLLLELKEIQAASRQKCRDHFTILASISQTTRDVCIDG